MLDNGDVDTHLAVLNLAPTYGNFSFTTPTFYLLSWEWINEMKYHLIASEN